MHFVMKDSQEIEDYKNITMIIQVKLLQPAEDITKT